MTDVWRIVNALVLLKIQHPYWHVTQIIWAATGEVDPFEVSDAALADDLEDLLKGRDV